MRIKFITIHLNLWRRFSIFCLCPQQIQPTFFRSKRISRIDSLVSERIYRISCLQVLHSGKSTHRNCNRFFCPLFILCITVFYQNITLCLCCFYILNIRIPFTHQEISVSICPCVSVPVVFQHQNTVICIMDLYIINIKKVCQDIQVCCFHSVFQTVCHLFDRLIFTSLFEGNRNLVKSFYLITNHLICIGFSLIQIIRDFQITI